MFVEGVRDARRVPNFRAARRANRAQGFGVLKDRLYGLRSALDDPFAVMPRAGLDQSRHSPSKKREQPKLPPPSHSVDQDRSRTAEWASLLSMRRPYSSVSSIFSASPVLEIGRAHV